MVQAVILKEGESIHVDIDALFPLVTVSLPDAEGSRQTAVVKASSYEEPPLTLINDNSTSQVMSDSTLGSISHVFTVLEANNTLLKTVMAIGPTKTGKSTTVRMAINQLLHNTDESVFLLETDMGQPSINLPGFISLRKITKASICNSSGWRPESFCNSDNIFMKFIGDFSPEGMKRRLDKALIQVRQLIERIRLTGVLFINTCGWIKGMGNIQLSEMVELFEPLFVIQMADEGEILLKEKPTNKRSRAKAPAFINIDPFVPLELKSSLPHAKDWRQHVFKEYFQRFTSEASFDLSRLDVQLLLKNTDKYLSDTSTPFELASLLIGSIIAIEIDSDLDIPALIYDCDMESSCINLRLEPEYHSRIATLTRVKILKSEFIGPEVFISHSSEVPLFQQRIFWAGPMIGVGNKPMRRVVSRRQTNTSTS